MEHVGALVLLTVLTAAFLLIHGPWQEFCVARARQRVFEARDAVFDLAVERRLAFESPEYQTIRECLQALIRYAHELSLIKGIALIGALQRTGGLGGRSALFVTIDSLEDPELRHRVTWLVWSAHKAILEMIILRSPLLWLPAIVLWHVPRRLSVGRMAVDRAVKFVQSEAEDADRLPPLDPSMKLAA